MLSFPTFYTKNYIKCIFIPESIIKSVFRNITMQDLLHLGAQKFSARASSSHYIFSPLFCRCKKEKKRGLKFLDFRSLLQKKLAQFPKYFAHYATGCHRKIGLYSRSFLLPNFLLLLIRQFLAFVFLCLKYLIYLCKFESKHPSFNCF